MPDKLWLKDGKLILNDDGKLLLCDECPCGGFSYTIPSCTCAKTIWPSTLYLTLDADNAGANCNTVDLPLANNPVGDPRWVGGYPQVGFNGGVSFVIEASCGPSCGFASGTFCLSLVVRSIGGCLGVSPGQIMFSRAASVLCTNPINVTFALGGGAGTWCNVATDPFPSGCDVVADVFSISVIE